MAQSEKKRSKNFSDDEKALTITYIKERKSIIESKSADLSVIKKKRNAWQEVSNHLLVNGFKRDPKCLKEFYARLKCQAKNSIRKYRSN